MRAFEEMCRAEGAVLVCESVICNETPNEEGEAACAAFEKALA